MMHGRGKSDSAIVAVKPTNKAEQSAAESVERRAGASPRLARFDHSLDAATTPQSRGKQKCRAHPRNDAIDPKLTAPGSWQRVGGGSPPRGRFSQPPRPRVMHEVLLARAAVKRSQGRPRAKY
jgi:hypothetical protein